MSAAGAGLAADWRADALCAQVGGDLWYPEVGDTATARTAVRICEGCPVRAECLGWALGHAELHGIWGGTTPDERRALRRAARQAVAA